MENYFGSQRLSFLTYKTRLVGGFNELTCVETDGTFVHKPGSKKAVPAPSAPGSCGAQTKVFSQPSEALLDRRDLKGKPALQALLGCPGGHELEPLVSCLTDSPRGSADLVLEGLTQSSFFSHPSPPDVPLFFLRVSFLPSPLPSPPPPRDRVTARHPGSAGLPSSPSKDLPKFCCCTALQHVELGPLPSPAEREGYPAGVHAPNLHLSVQKSFLTSSPLLPQDQAHVGVQTNSFSWPLQRH